MDPNRKAREQIRLFYRAILDAAGGEIWSQELTQSKSMLDILRPHMEDTGPWDIICGWWNNRNPVDLIQQAEAWHTPGDDGPIRVYFLSNSHLKTWVLRDQMGAVTYWEGTANFKEPCQANRMTRVDGEKPQAWIAEDLAYFRTLLTPYHKGMTGDEIRRGPVCDGHVVAREGSVTSIGRCIYSYERDQWAQGRFINAPQVTATGPKVPGGTPPPPVSPNSVNVFGGHVTIEQVGER
jgi:hypothetical protein